MKYGSNHPFTRRCLRTWVGEKNLHVANNFFCSSGSRMQKSQEGLVRSHLCQILRECPALIPTACPFLWNACATPYDYNSPLSFDREYGFHGWSVTELLH